VSDVGETDTINRTLYYSTKFQADPDTAGDWTEYTTQPADNATFATAKAALLAGLNETDATAETRGTLPLSLKMVRTTTAASGDLLLDTYTGAAAAYSVRKLDKDYTGYAIRVREDSGDTEADIGFDSNGDLDTAAIATHCGSANGYVVTWYDQSGNSNNATQSTAGNQPQIYNGTAVITENGQPAIDFDGSSHYLEAADSDDFSFTDGAGTDTYISAFATLKLTSTATNSRVLFSKDSGSPNREYAWGYFGFQDDARFFLKDNGGNNQISQDATTPTQLNLHQVGALLYDASETAAGITMYINGAASTMGNTVSQTYSGMANTSAPFRIGAQNATNFFFGIVQELVLYSSDQSSNRSGIETDVNDYFSIYTP
jgi:hypothetical protein